MFKCVECGINEIECEDTLCDKCFYEENEDEEE